MNVVFEHTPGPWKRWPTAREEFSQVVTAIGSTVEICYTKEILGEKRTYIDESRSIETTANARLIAAAPDLLEALHRLLVAIEVDIDMGAISAAKAAIEKATNGEESRCMK